MTFAWAKGHGTENDFIVLPDGDGTIHGELSAEFVAMLCDRRRGIGADGVIRVIRSTALADFEPSIALPPESVDEERWFMDYRNADGSAAQMCGNGARVFARYLVETGLVKPDQEFDIDTRDGTKHIIVDADLITVDMGDYQVAGFSDVRLENELLSARDVRTGNPHAVTFVTQLAQAGPLIDAPGFDTTVYPEGVNIEFVQRIDDRHIAMRVYERGSGETRSCGTGACAAAIATAAADGVSTGRYRVDVLGGTLHVTLANPQRVQLTGPAELVASGKMIWLK